jgi:hypothetical protein
MIDVGAAIEEVVAIVAPQAVAAAAADQGVVGGAAGDHVVAAALVMDWLPCLLGAMLLSFVVNK